MKKSNILCCTLVTSLLLVGACRKKEITPDPVPESPASPGYTVPTSYNFANADFSESTLRLDMLAELTGYIRSTHTTTQTSQPVLDAQKLRNMYQNVSAPFATAALNNSGLQLKDKTSDKFNYKTQLEANFDEAAAASLVASGSPTLSTASKGVKGKIIAPSRAILVDANGFEYKEFAEKGLMGALSYHQAMIIMSTIHQFDNTSLVNGRTAQEKAWDDAFGYFGVPASFPTSTVGLKNWGTYCNAVNSAINSNSTMMNAFLKGRAAISNKDVTARDEAKTVVMSTWELVAAAKCINYLKGARNGFADQGTLFHGLSEASGFVSAFAYNPAKKVSDADIAALHAYIGNNLYDITLTNIDAAISKLAAVYNLDASKL